MGQAAGRVAAGLASAVVPELPTEPDDPANAEAATPELRTPEPAIEGDALPADLDVSAYVGVYQFPDIRRRRIAGTMYLVVAAGCAAGYAKSRNGGLLAAAVMLALIALYHYASAWPLRVDQTESLAVASRTVGFPVGHASAQLAWRGLLSRPA